MKTTDFINKFTEDAEYDDEAGMAKNSLHTIIRVATHLERALADDENLPEWVQEKIGAIKGMMVSVMDYMISQHEMGRQEHVPTFDANTVMESFESMINEAAIKPEQLAQLNQLKRSMQQQAMQPKAVDADTQAEIDAWERDFAATHGSRTFAQDNPVADAPADAGEDWRTQPRDTRKKLQAQLAKVDRLISMGQKMMALIDRSEKFPGGIPPGLRSDLENLEAAFDKQNPDYDTLIDLYTKRLGQLQDFVSMKRAVYRKPKTPRYNEGAPIATTPDSIDPGGATDNFKQQMANNTEVAYQKNLAGVTEGEDYSPVVQAITRRIMLQRTDLLSKFGPERVGAAIDEVADFVGDVEEIGTSDVSGWVRQVERNLGDYQLDEDATGGSMGSSSVATVMGELGEGGITRKQVNKKLGGYTNVQTKGGKIRVKGSY